jgi:hypothetical protein
MIEVSNVVMAYPEIDEGNSGVRSITIKNHWHDPSKVVILVEGCPVTVNAKDLLVAISNATNSGR